MEENNILEQCLKDYLETNLKAFPNSQQHIKLKIGPPPPKKKEKRKQTPQNSRVMKHGFFLFSFPLFCATSKSQNQEPFKISEKN